VGGVKTKTVRTTNGRGDDGGGVTRTDETRKWDEGPREVEGNGDPH
jgi:hypothetical protein